MSYLPIYNSEPYIKTILVMIIGFSLIWVFIEPTLYVSLVISIPSFVYSVIQLKSKFDLENKEDAEETNEDTSSESGPEDLVIQENPIIGPPTFELKNISGRDINHIDIIGSNIPTRSIESLSEGQSVRIDTYDSDLSHQKTPIVKIKYSYSSDNKLKCQTVVASEPKDFT